MYVIVLLILDVIIFRIVTTNKFSVDRNSNMSVFLYGHAESQPFAAFSSKNFGQTLRRPRSLVVCKEKPMTCQVLIDHEAKRYNILKIYTEYLTDLMGKK